LERKYSQVLNRLSKSIYWNMDFKSSREFEHKYLQLGLQRGKIFNWLIFVLSFYNFYLDFALWHDSAIDHIYRRNLFIMHIIIILTSMIYLVLNYLLDYKKLQTSLWAKALLLSEISITALVASYLSINSQRFTGNMNAYIMIILVLALVIPLYPKWVLSIYAVNHILFLAGLSHYCRDNSITVKQFNSTTTVMVAMVLFLVLYRYNITNFLNEEMLREDKQTFIKLFEINPFPLLISRFEDGKILYANDKAIIFYEFPNEIPGSLSHEYLYKNHQDFNNIRSMLETDGKIMDYMAEQKTMQGKIKYAVVNYELIDYFGEKSILSGVADISEIKRIEQELSLYASTDPLTGVLNRRAGMELIRRRLEAARYRNEEFNLCFFDVDHLKMVNDTYGHLEGDALIVEVCKVVGSELHPNDIIFRYGGDEFIIFFDHNCEQEVQNTCGRIRQRFDILNQEQNKPYRIDASLGIFSGTPDAKLSLEQIIETADKDMYHDKEIKRQEFR
jgi:diguanylate cyclase (GGDEF)-like protein